MSQFTTTSNYPPTVSYRVPFLTVTIDLYGKTLQQVESDAHDVNRIGRTPTGLALWPSGKLVSDFLACAGGNPSSVIELGCGLGLCGLVSQVLMLHSNRTSSCSPCIVVLTDADDETLLAAQTNSQQYPQTVCDRLDWCSIHDRDRVKQYHAAEGFDRVVASDVIYEMTASWVPDLFRTAKSFMVVPGGIFILGIQRRTTSLESVKQVAHEEGLEGGQFVSNFLLDIFNNRLEVSNDNDDNHNESRGEDASDNIEDDTGSSSLLWSAAVLVYWHANDKIGKQIAIQLCATAIENSHTLDDS